jgi:hypothetical protein
MESKKGKPTTGLSKFDRLFGEHVKVLQLELPLMQLELPLNNAGDFGGDSTSSSARRKPDVIELSMDQIESRVFGEPRAVCC